MNPIKERLSGLDILRSMAILLVFMYHYVIFVSHKPTFGFIDEIGWVGVDLFFALSGYLIGNQIFSSLAMQQVFSFKLFYYRRLLRTLPAYLFVLGMYTLIPFFREHSVLPPLWKFLTFTQNFNLQTGTAFSHAWSLCIEEQFYLVLPLMALLFLNQKSKQYAWVILLSVVIAGMFLRGWLWTQYIEPSPNNFQPLYYTKIYYASFCRLDELVFGVAIALLKNFHQQTWVKVTQKGNLILLFGIFTTAITFYFFIQYHFSFVMTTFGHPLLGLSFASLVCAALCKNSLLYKIKVPGAATLATWSYSIYLLHKPMSVIIAREMVNLDMNLSDPVLILVITSGTFFCGWLLYIGIELPFLKLREKIGKRNVYSFWGKRSAF